MYILNICHALTFDLTIVTFTFKIFSGLYLGNHMIEECGCSTSRYDFSKMFGFCFSDIFEICGLLQMIIMCTFT